MQDFILEQLEAFIVKAKAATYVSDGAESPACRSGSHDLQFRDGDFAYLDSYFGGTDFIGEEVVYYKGEPVWAMNYYGRILEPEMIAAAETGQIIKQSLSAMYQEGRFLGGFEYDTGDGVYTDTSREDLYPPRLSEPGIGAQAFEFIWSEYPDVEKWTLGTPAWNRRNRHFYKKVGFVEVGEDGRGGILFERNIAPD